MLPYSYLTVLQSVLQKTDRHKHTYMNGSLIFQIYVLIVIILLLRATTPKHHSVFLNMVLSLQLNCVCLHLCSFSKILLLFALLPHT